MKTLSEDGTIRVAAVIDIGSSAIRMVILEIHGDGTYRRLDRTTKPVRLGQDVFMDKLIKRETVAQAIRILTGFSELMAAWGVEKENTFAIATSAIREAQNRDTFLDRVLVKTGIQVQVVEGVEENHLTFIAVQHAVESMHASFSRANSLILEVGSGSVELMILKRGKMAATHTLRKGIMRLDQSRLSNSSRNLHAQEEYIREQYRVSMEALDIEAKLGSIRYFIMVGGDARIVAHRIGTKTEEHFWTLSREEFMNFTKELARHSPHDLVKEMSISYHEAESLVTALTVYQIFLEETDAETIIIPNVSIREGVILRYAMGKGQQLHQQFASQVRASAASLGKKYRYDESHGVCVCDLSLQLFDQLQVEHGLSERERLFLEIAALLHDIGYFIAAARHHKHGEYIIKNSEIFGLSRHDILIISNLVRFHRGGRPGASDPEFFSLTRAERLVVLKLAAILRVADALDRGHSQRIRQLSTQLEDDEMHILVKEHGDLSLERSALASKGTFFEEVFGYKLLLDSQK